MAHEARGADGDADDEIRADRAGGLLADPADEGGHPEGAEDEPDQPAEHPDHETAEDGGADIEPGTGRTKEPLLSGAGGRHRRPGGPTDHDP